VQQSRERYRLKNIIIFKSNKTPTWCNTVLVLFLQSHSTCFGRQGPIIRSIRKLARWPLVQVLQLQVGHHITIWWCQCKMWIIHEPNTLELWNKLHFEEEIREYIPCSKYSVNIFVE
jgi:hypothetical protein